MAKVRPFKAVRPFAGKAEKVVSLPYDVMNRTEAAEMAAGNPYSFLHISRAEIDLPEEKDAYARRVYEKARDNLTENLRSGVFIREAAPAFYLYRQTMAGRVQTGIVGCVSVDEYADNTIKKHELTRVEKETDRICHFDICNANTEPVFLTYRENKTISEITESYIESHDPEYDFVTESGIGHQLWPVTDKELIERISEAFSAVSALYIADGHHRSASAYHVGELRRKQNPDYTGEEEFNYFMAVLYPDSALKIYDYNRVVADLNGLNEEEFLHLVEKAGFTVELKGEKPWRPEKAHRFSMYLSGKWYRLTAEERLISDDPVLALDVSILQNHLLNPILDIKDPRTDKRIDFVGGIRGLQELERRAETDMKLAFAMYPVTVENLMEISDAGKIMPPKSTWFEPKIGSGLFIHEL